MEKTHTPTVLKTRSCGGGMVENRKLHEKLQNSNSANMIKWGNSRRLTCSTQWKYKRI